MSTSTACAGVLALTLAGWAAGRAAVASAQDAAGDSVVTFREGVDVATVRLTVRNDDDRLVTNLTRDDFQMMIDGRPAPVVAFGVETRPVAVALMINTWMDIVQVKRLREVGHAFVDALAPDERGVVGSFAQEIAITPFVTNDKRVLHRVLDEELWAGNGNPVWNALRLATSSIGTESRKRVVVFVGSHISPFCFKSSPGRVCDTKEQALAEAASKDIWIYGIQLPGGFRTPQMRAYPGVPRGSGRGLEAMVLSPGPEILQIARDTESGYLRLRDDDLLPETMRAVLEELRREYLIGITPPARDSRRHTLRVRFRRSGLTAQVRSVSGLEFR